MLCLSLNALSQSFKTEERIIDSLISKGLPKSALQRVDQLAKLARQQNNTSEQVKAALYRMTLQSYVEENALITIIAGLRLDIAKAGYPVKPVLQSVLANMYYQYYQQNRWQFSQRSKLEKAGPDFTKWDLQTIIEQVTAQYNLSLQDPQALQQTPVDVLDGLLTGDRSVRFLRPSLYDFLVQRALTFFLADEPAITKPRLPFSLRDPRFFGGSRSFANMVITTTDTASTWYKGLRYLQQATLFHLRKNDREALADLDLERLKFVHEKNGRYIYDFNYLEALKQVARDFADKPISADALVLIGEYYIQKDSLARARFFLEKAIISFPQSIGGKNAAIQLRNQVLAQTLSITTEETAISHKAILARIEYRNVKTANVLIYKLTGAQTDQLDTLTRGRTNDNFNKKITYQPAGVVGFFAQLVPVQTQKLQLPDPGDYKEHGTEFKIDPLPPGCYTLLLNDGNDTDTGLVSYSNFNVSRLAYISRINPDGHTQLNVMDRVTGRPLKNVEFDVDTYTGGYGAQPYKITSTETGLTPDGGIVILKNRKEYYAGCKIRLVLKKDTLTDWRSSIQGGMSLQDTSEKAARHTGVIFSDRQIYRPGQTIYFNVLKIKQKNGDQAIEAFKSDSIMLKGNDYKTLSVIQYKTNAFGTFSGSFNIPQNILTGNITLVSGGYNQRLVLSVEEYKRPAFEVKFLPVTQSYKPDDSVMVKGTINAYSGYGLSNVKVAYHLTRHAGNYSYVNGALDYRTYYGGGGGTDEIRTDTIITNNRGEFTISFKASPGDGAVIDQQINIFSINIDATDQSGETRSGETSVSVSQNNLQIDTRLPAAVLTNDTVIIPVTVNNLNLQPQGGTIAVQVYALQNVPKLTRFRKWNDPDQLILSPAEYDKYFPEYNDRLSPYYGEARQLNQVAHFDVVTTTDKPGLIDLTFLNKQKSGVYKIMIKAVSLKGDTASIIRYVRVINSNLVKQQFMGWFSLVVNTHAKVGQNAKIFIGSDTTGSVLMEKFNGPKLIVSQWLKVKKGQKLVNIPITATDTDVYVQFMMLKNNYLYSVYQKIFIRPVKSDLNLRFLTFRDKLQPGQKEQWKLQVTGNGNEKITAEILAGLSDASLDAIKKPASWQYLLKNNQGTYDQDHYFRWDASSFLQQQSSQSVFVRSWYQSVIKRDYEALYMFNYDYYGGKNYGYINYKAGFASGKHLTIDAGDLRVPTVINAKDLEELASTSIVQSLQGGSARKDIVASSVDPGVIDDLEKLRLKSALNDKPGGFENAIATRKNFNETAFFYPQLHTDEKGEVAIDFSMPESLTRWHFQALAHTGDLRTGYLEQEIVTQKQLSISMNTPRFLREGDSITISARLANLTASPLTGKVALQLFNGVNMQPVSILFNSADAIQSFSVTALSTSTLSFRLLAPAGLDALTYRLTADGGRFTDGEENTLPVLPNSVLVTESMPMMVRPGQTRSFTFDKLVNQNSATLKHKTLTLEYTGNPAWYAVQALPYMMEFPYECSEQIFSRYYANTLATGIIKKQPAIKQVFDQWKAAGSAQLLSNLEKDQELKATLIEETPWLRDAVDETERKKRVALLFDLNKMSYELKQNVDKLKSRQLPDGGFPWFGGDQSDGYVTRHIAEGIGRLYHLHIADTLDATLKNIAEKALTYIDRTLLDNANAQKKQDIYDGRILTPDEIHAWYVESYFTARPLPAALKPLLNNYLARIQSARLYSGIYGQGMMALTMLRYNKAGVAQKIIRSLMETAQHADDKGMYWGKNQLGYSWYRSPVEAQCTLIELFTEAGNNDKAVEEMKIWLLRDKQTNNWRTTIATAAACYALLLKGGDWLAAGQKPEIKLGNQILESLKPGLQADAGTGYLKAAWLGGQVKPDLGKVSIRNTGNTISWGALHWQYLENLEKITPSKTEMYLERKYFIQKQTGNGMILTAVDATHKPKVGDVLKVVLYLKADRDFEYIQLKDMRPAGTEPLDVLSAPKYQDGLYYYQVTKDVATNFFISQLQKGNYVIEYRLRVTQPGNFSTGISTVQCMYAPEFNAHTPAERIVMQ